MDKNNNNNNGSRIGFTELLTVLFIGLKLTNIINWTWLWVLSPLWISFGLGILVVLIALIITKGSLK